MRLVALLDLLARHHRGARALLAHGRVDGGAGHAHRIHLRRDVQADRQRFRARGRNGCAVANPGAVTTTRSVRLDPGPAAAKPPFPAGGRLGHHAHPVHRGDPRAGHGGAGRVEHSSAQVGGGGKKPVKKSGDQTVIEFVHNGLLPREPGISDQISPVGLLTCASAGRSAFPSLAGQWLWCDRPSTLTVAGPCWTYTSFPGNRKIANILTVDPRGGACQTEAAAIPDCAISL